jgi:hypothetical protein
VTASGAQKGSTQPSIAAAHYEALRNAALGQALPLEARSGLALFLRRGMWGWARVLAATNVPEQPIRSPSSAAATPYEHQSVIHVFAAMAMSTHDRRVR